MFWAANSFLKGELVPAVLADFASGKIDRAAWSSYGSELQAATIGIHPATV